MTLNSQKKIQEIPRHIAIIMDGNGRWAKKRFLPRVAGHRQGVENVREIVKESAKQGVEVLTLFAFSSENWRRPQSEVNFLMELLQRTIQNEVQSLHKNQVKLRVIGDRTVLSSELNLAIENAENLTKSNTGLVLNVALNYGGRWDIFQAVQRIVKEAVEGRLPIEELTESQLGQYISLGDLPEPDLFIRTSGERRISNFLLWQDAYTELYFTDKLWPDFTKEDLIDAFQFFAGRERRFGQTSEQIKEHHNA